MTNHRFTCVLTFEGEREAPMMFVFLPVSKLNLGTNRKVVRKYNMNSYIVRYKKLTLLDTAKY
jgi:hypothetical protein